MLYVDLTTYFRFRFAFLALIGPTTSALGGSVVLSGEVYRLNSVTLSAGTILSKCCDEYMMVFSFYMHSLLSIQAEQNSFIFRYHMSTDH